MSPLPNSRRARPSVAAGSPVAAFVLLSFCLARSEPVCGQVPTRPVFPASAEAFDAADGDAEGVPPPQALFAPPERGAPGVPVRVPGQMPSKPTHTDAAAPSPSRRMDLEYGGAIESPAAPGPLVNLQILEKELRFERIRNQIRDLIQARQKSAATTVPSEQSFPAAPGSSQQGSTPAATVLAEAASGAAVPSQDLQTPAEAGAGNVPPEKPTSDAEATASAPENGVSAEHPGNEGSSAPPGVDATPAVAVDEPIDRLGLADSLYLAGELTLAFDAYTQVDRAKLGPADSYWIDYQLAACHRRLGRREQASELYRKLAGEPAAAWLAELSRWWLDRMAERAALKQQSEQLADVLRDLSAQIDGMNDDERNN